MAHIIDYGSIISNQDILLRDLYVITAPAGNLPYDLLLGLNFRVRTPSINYSMRCR
jgi:hypothetical protein